MIIHHTGGLHVGIADRCAEKLKAAFFHVLADGIGYGCAGHYLGRLIHDRFPPGHKAVKVFIKRAKLPLHLNKMLRIGNGRKNF